MYDHFAVIERRKTGIRLEAESCSMDEIAWSGIYYFLLPTSFIRAWFYYYLFIFFSHVTHCGLYLYLYVINIYIQMVQKYGISTNTESSRWGLVKYRPQYTKLINLKTQFGSEKETTFLNFNIYVWCSLKSEPILSPPKKKKKKTTTWIWLNQLVFLKLLIWNGRVSYDLLCRCSNCLSQEKRAFISEFL